MITARDDKNGTRAAGGRLLVRAHACAYPCVPGVRRETATGLRKLAGVGLEPGNRFGEMQISGHCYPFAAQKCLSDEERRGTRFSPIGNNVDTRAKQNGAPLRRY